MIPIEDLDEVHECVPVTCGHSGAGLVGTDPEPVRHQVAATSFVIVFMIHRRRNTEAAKELLGEDFAGPLCVDRWSAYTWVERRGLYLAHLMRDFQAMIERPSGQWYAERLVASGQRVLGTWAAWNAGEIDRESMLQLIAPERRRIQRLLEQGAKASLVPGKTRAVCRNLAVHQDGCNATGTTIYINYQ